MEQFRRPLGVLLASVLVFVVCLIVTAATVSVDTIWPQMVFGWLAVLALATGLGALAVIAWRLVRRPKPRNDEERPATR